MDHDYVKPGANLRLALLCARKASRLNTLLRFSDRLNQESHFELYTAATSLFNQTNTQGFSST